MSQSETRVLIVEDGEELAPLISDYLTEHGLRVLVISDGAEAEREVRSFDPDLVILDQMLPNKDGLSICRALRSHFAGPIVFLTARSGWVDEVVGLEQPYREWLQAPAKRSGLGKTNAPPPPGTMQVVGTQYCDASRSGCFSADDLATDLGSDSASCAPVGASSFGIGEELDSDTSADAGVKRGHDGHLQLLQSDAGGRP